VRTLHTHPGGTGRGRAAAALLATIALLLAVAGCAKGRQSSNTPVAQEQAQTQQAQQSVVYQVSVQKFTYQGMPDSVPADKPFTIVFSNKESFEITHELVIVAIPAGKTLDDLVADAKAKGADSEDDWLHFGEIGEVNTGATGVGTFALPPGTYAIACWQEGKAGGGKGPVHASIGMAKSFTVS
jgi:uncharacterized cupredoxin-like copper-binding protein